MTKNISAFMDSLEASQSAYYLIKEWNKGLDKIDLTLGTFVNAHSVPVSTCLVLVQGFGFFVKLSWSANFYNGQKCCHIAKNANENGSLFVLMGL